MKADNRSERILRSVTHEMDDSILRVSVLSTAWYSLLDAPFPLSRVTCFPRSQIRNRCRFFFGTACVVSVGLCLTAAVVSGGVQTFVILVIVLNLTVGLALTYDIREWPHRLQEIILYVIFLCESLGGCFAETVTSSGTWS